MGSRKKEGIERRVRGLAAWVAIGMLGTTAGTASAADGAAATYVGGPVLDPKIMPEEPAKAYAAGKAARMPFMVGANSLDIGFMQGKTVAELLSQFGPDTDKARFVYGVKDTDDVKAVAFRMGGDQIMGEPARFVARELASRGQPVLYTSIASQMCRTSLDRRVGNKCAGQGCRR